MDNSAQTIGGTAAEPSPLPSLVGPLEGLDVFSALPAGETILYVLNTIWGVYTVLAFLVSAGFIYGTIYAMQRKSQLGALQHERLREQEKLFQQKKHGGPQNDRWSDVLTHIESMNPNDWRLAIIEADIILEEALEERGLAGTTIGEKLKSASPEQFSTLDDAWRAHRVRNQIAHAGSDFVLTQKVAQETINQFKRVFTELGKI